MPRITLSLPDQLKQQLDLYPLRNWPEIFRGILQKKVNQLKKFEKLTERGKI